MKYSGPLLLVEDDENDVFFMRRAFKEAQITNALHVASDGREALAYLGAEGPFSDRLKYPMPGLIFLDLKLPGKSGHEVLAWWQKQPGAATTVVLVLSTSAEDQDIQTAYKLGAHAYLVKPPTPKDLTEMVQSIKKFWLQINEYPPASAPPGTPLI